MRSAMRRGAMCCGSAMRSRHYRLRRLQLQLLPVLGSLPRGLLALRFDLVDENRHGGLVKFGRIVPLVARCSAWQGRLLDLSRRSHTQSGGESGQDRAPVPPLRLSRTGRSGKSHAARHVEIAKAIATDFRTNWGIM
jgi:hypothetical protein